MHMKFPAPEEMAGWTEEQTRQFWRSLDVKDKEQTAIARLQEASRMSLQVYKQPLVVTTSGGKDSSVCVTLAERASIPFEVQHNHTTADAPETVYFVRAEFKRLELAGIQCCIRDPYLYAQFIKIGIPTTKTMPNRILSIIFHTGFSNIKQTICFRA